MAGRGSRRGQRAPDRVPGEDISCGEGTPGPTPTWSVPASPGVTGGVDYSARPSPPLRGARRPPAPARPWTPGRRRGDVAGRGERPSGPSRPAPLPPQASIGGPPPLQTGPGGLVFRLPLLAAPALAPVGSNRCRARRSEDGDPSSLPCQGRARSEPGTGGLGGVWRSPLKQRGIRPERSRAHVASARRLRGTSSRCSRTSPTGGPFRGVSHS